MSGECSIWAWAQRESVESASHLLVLLAVANIADETGFCWPSQKYIAEQTNLSTRTVRSALAKLEGLGLLERNPEYNGPVRTSDNIQLLLTEVVVFKGGRENLAAKGDSRRRGVRRDLPGDAAPAARKPSREPTTEPIVRKSAGARANMAPDDWEPKDAHREKVSAFGWPDGMMEEQAERFKEWEFREAKTDFDRAFHRWLRTENDRLKGRGHGGAGFNGGGSPLGGGPQSRQDRIGAMHRGAMAAADRFQRDS